MHIYISKIHNYVLMNYNPSYISLYCTDLRLSSHRIPIFVMDKLIVQMT